MNPQSPLTLRLLRRRVQCHCKTVSEPHEPISVFLLCRVPMAPPHAGCHIDYHESDQVGRRRLTRGPIDQWLTAMELAEEP